MNATRIRAWAEAVGYEAAAAAAYVGPDTVAMWAAGINRPPKTRLPLIVHLVEKWERKAGRRVRSRKAEA